ncbi:aminopeptidase [Aquimarina agarivorans]|uniref:aminopeptidase n=1 Tax=Aquimarina agarivorans TaxID=980584 RepID=UPI000248E88E|nr:aminopeptidase [Aquimarina agarivorans]
MVFLFVSLICSGQNESYLNAVLFDELKTIVVIQELQYQNTSNDTLNEIYLLDWANAFSSKETPLTVRFNEDFRRAFHFSSKKERGYTEIVNFRIGSEKSKQWFRLDEHPDVIKVKLTDKLLPGEKVKLEFQFQVKIPDDRFTKYGYGKNEYQLRYWHLAPALYNHGWNFFSHKNLNDFSAAICNYTLNFKSDTDFYVETNLNKTSEDKNGFTTYKENNVTNIVLYLSKKQRFDTINYKNKLITTDIPKESLNDKEQKESIQKVYDYVEAFFGELPQKKLLLSYTNYKKQPVYGFNQLPNKLRPFKPNFQYEMILLKEMTKEFNKQCIQTDLRKDHWFTDAIQVYAMINYVDTFYPDSKLTGRLSKFIGVRWFHAAKLSFNDQYYLGAKNMAARFLEQPLTTPKDSLLKFNYNISSPYKAGMGLNYLDKNLNGSLKKTIAHFFSNQKLKNTTSNDFNKALENSTEKDISWFTKNFVNSDSTLDLKIKGVTRKKDSVYLHLKNKGTSIPVKITGLKKKKISTEKWVPNFEDSLTIGFQKKRANHFVLDYDEYLPEVNRRNNYWKTTGVLNKKIQFRLFQDIEDPKYHQTFLLPVWDFNVYDGFLPGINLFNKSLIRRNFNYNLSPAYGIKSKKILGSFGVGHTHQFKKTGWYLINFGVSASTFSYAPDLLFRTFTPTISINYRPKDLRKNISQRISNRLVSIQREKDPNIPLQTPNYNVFNTRYRYSDPNLTYSLGILVDFQQAKNFNKIAATFGYSKLFLNNQRINFRFFGGTFINNKTQADGDFFSFALDRPTDYLFDFNYLGRVESSGITSQQFISAEGNFKSQLTPAFANQWLATTTVESSIWNWIQAYADAGLVKNKGFAPEFVYDSGIKLNLLTNYLELFFPLQSSLGFEPSFSDYEKRIRFKVSLSINTLVGLFTREWY